MRQATRRLVVVVVVAVVVVVVLRVVVLEVLLERSRAPPHQVLALPLVVGVGARLFSEL